MQKTSTGLTQLCVIYKSLSGKILHIHSETFADGMKLLSEDEMERRARHHAHGRKRDLGGAKALHLREPKFTGWPKRVDPKTGKIEMTDPRSSGRNGGFSQG
jgi:hypothetical protein